MWTHVPCTLLGDVFRPSESGPLVLRPEINSPTQMGEASGDVGQATCGPHSAPRAVGMLDAAPRRHPGLAWTHWRCLCPPVIAAVRSSGSVRLAAS